MPEQDPGLAPERTQLAWRRTGLSFVVAALAVFRVFTGCPTPWACASGPSAFVEVTVLILVAAALFLEAARRKPALPADEDDRRRPTVALGELVPATIGNLLLAVAAAAAVLSVA